MYIERKQECNTIDCLIKSARDIANVAFCPSIITLSGDLGSGKTTWARAFIQSIADVTVPSPTFTLMYCYETKIGRISHWDMYRMTDNNIAIYDFLEALSDCITIVEWPEKIPNHVCLSEYCDRLSIQLLNGIVSYVGYGKWISRIQDMF